MSDDIHDQPTGAWQPGDGDFDVEVRESFEGVLDRFEAAWQTGEPDIAEYAAARPGDEALVVELCLVDLEHRRKRGLPASLEAYTERFPALADRLRELAAMPAATAPALRGQAADTLVGREIGDVTIVRLIGQGGMGRVYEGRQRKPRRPVAVKVMQPGVASPALLKRFEYEAQVLARLRHPGIAHIYAVGTHEVDGESVPYFVMEYIPNARTLTQYAEEQKLSTHERLELFQKVCDAVAHGHQKGVIHRDLKPANVVVDSTGQPKVIDFGVAKATDSDLALTTMQTDVGAIIGTLQYMSPEQFDADPDDLDVRLDVYALGVVLYELLTGRPPYDVKRKAIYEVARVVREEEPTPITSLDRTLRRDVAVIAGKCLEKDRTRRYSSAAELAGDVGRYLAGEPIAAAPPSLWAGVVRLARRHKAAAVAVAGVAASLVAAVIGISAFAIRAERARKEAAKVAEFQSQMLERIDATVAGRSLMTDIRERVTAALEKAGVPADERARQADTFGRLLDRVNATDTAAAMIDRTLLAPALTTIDVSFQGEPQTAASLRQALANVYRVLGLYDAALPLQQRALDLRRRVLGDDHPDTLTSIGTMGVLLQGQGKLAEAESFYRESLERHRRVLGEDHRRTLVSLSNMGGLLQAQGKLVEAESLISEARERSRRVLGEDHPLTLVSITVTSGLLREQGKFAEAEPLFREALEKKLRVLGADHPHTLVAIGNMGAVLQDQGKFAEAEPFVREAAEKCGRVLGEDHPDTLTATNRLGALLQAQGKLAEAEPVNREALERFRRVLGKDHLHTLTATIQLGALLQARGKLAEAEPFIREALEGYRRALGEDHPHTLVAIGNLAAVLRDQGKFAEAEPFQREAFDKFRRVFGEDHPNTLTSINGMGLLLQAQGKLAEAEPLLREALDKFRRVRGEDHPQTLVSISIVGSLLKAQGKLTEAEPFFREALERFRRVLGEDHPDTLTSINNMGSLLQAQGRFAEADALFTEAVRSCRQAFPRPHPTTAMLLHHHADVLRETGRLDDAEKLAREAAAMYRDHPEWPANEARHAEKVLADILSGVETKP